MGNYVIEFRVINKAVRKSIRSILNTCVYIISKFCVYFSGLPRTCFAKGRKLMIGHFFCG